MKKKKIKIKGYIIGIEQIDLCFCGLQDGDLYCLCCSTEVERSELLAKIVTGLASRQISVLLLTLDYSYLEMYGKILTIIQKYDTSLSKDDLILRKSEAINKYGTFAVWIEETHGLSYESLRNILQRLCYINHHAVECIIIDNILKMDTDFKTQTKGLALEANLYLLRMVAKEYKIPIIIASDYNDLSAKKLTESIYVNKILNVVTSNDNIIGILETFPSIIISSRHSANNLFESELHVIME